MHMILLYIMSIWVSDEERTEDVNITFPFSSVCAIPQFTDVSTKSLFSGE